MINLVLLLVCLAIGVLLRRFKALPNDAHLTLNAFIVNVCLPALTLVHTTQLHFEASQTLAILMPYILFVASMLFFGVLAPKLGFDRSTTGALIITAGISSISFVGFPIFEMLYGKTGLQTGILMSQAGSFVVCGTLGIITASYYGSAKPNLGQIFKDVFSFPPFVSFCIAIVINLLGIQLPDLLASILQKIASPFSLIALISVGLQISFDFGQIPLKPLLWGLGFKLLIAPIIIFVLYVLVLDQHNTIGHICVLGAGIGSMNTATIIAINHKLNPKLASMMVGVGIPLSLFTLFLIYVFL